MHAKRGLRRKRATVSVSRSRPRARHVTLLVLHSQGYVARARTERAAPSSPLRARDSRPVRQRQVIIRLRRLGRSPRSKAASAFNMRRSSRATRRIVAAMRFRCRAALAVATSRRWGVARGWSSRITPSSCHPRPRSPGHVMVVSVYWHTGGEGRDVAGLVRSGCGLVDPRRR